MTTYGLHRLLHSAAGTCRVRPTRGVHGVLVHLRRPCSAAQGGFSATHPSTCRSRGLCHGHRRHPGSLPPWLGGRGHGACVPSSPGALRPAALFVGWSTVRLLFDPKKPESESESPHAETEPAPQKRAEVSWPTPPWRWQLGAEAPRPGRFLSLPKLLPRLPNSSRKFYECVLQTCHFSRSCATAVQLVPRALANLLVLSSQQTLPSDEFSTNFAVLWCRVRETAFGRG